MYFVRIPFFIRLLFPKAITRIKTGEKKVYLTFDDGPIPEVTSWVLDVLKDENIHATFFCVGDNVFKYPDIFNQLIREGHKVGNHTFNHLPAFKTKTDQYVQNVVDAEDYIKTDLFRPPHGQLKLALYRILKKRYKIVFWDLLSCDFDQKKSGEQCLQITQKYVRPGSVIVFHDSLKAEKNLRYTLPRLIKYLKKEGYSFDVVS